MSGQIVIPITVDLTELGALIRAAVREALREEQTARSAVPCLPDGLVTKQKIAAAMGVSVATIDRFDREGAPYQRVGTSKRYDIVAYRAWLAARGSAPTTKATTSPRIDGATEDLLARNGLRIVAGGR